MSVVPTLTSIFKTCNVIDTLTCTQIVKRTERIIDFISEFRDHFLDSLCTSIGCQDSFLTFDQIDTIKTDFQKCKHSIGAIIHHSKIMNESPTRVRGKGCIQTNSNILEFLVLTLNVNNIISNILKLLRKIFNIAIHTFVPNEVINNAPKEPKYITKCLKLVNSQSQDVIVQTSFQLSKLNELLVSLNRINSTSVDIFASIKFADDFIKSMCKFDASFESKYQSPENAEMLHEIEVQHESWANKIAELHQILHTKSTFKSLIQQKQELLPKFELIVSSLNTITDGLKTVVEERGEMMKECK